MKVIQAQLVTRCGLCGDLIEVGQDISPLLKRWYHAECARGSQNPIPYQAQEKSTWDPEGLDLALTLLASYTTPLPEVNVQGVGEGGGRQPVAVAEALDSWKYWIERLFLT